MSTRCDPERCESPLCMGHSPLSAQQAMRASGVGIHPAQIAAFPAIRQRERESRETLDEPHHLSRMLDRRDAVKPGNDWYGTPSTALASGSSEGLFDRGVTQKRPAAVRTAAGRQTAFDAARPRSF